jgi:hypothetical protein
VLSDQGPIGRAGTARPTQALTTRPLLPKPDRAGLPPEWHAVARPVRRVAVQELDRGHCTASRTGRRTGTEAGGQRPYPLGGRSAAVWRHERTGDDGRGPGGQRRRTDQGEGTRLNTHASGRRSGDQFCVDIGDRSVVPGLTHLSSNRWPPVPCRSTASSERSSTNS